MPSAFSKRCRAFWKSWRGFAQLCKSFLKMLESGFQCLLTSEKIGLDEFEKRLDEFVKMSRRVFPFVLTDIICSKPLLTASLIKTSVMFQTVCVPMCYGEPTLIFCLHIPFSSLKRIWKERFTSLHRIFLSFNKFETWNHLFSNLLGFFVSLGGILS